MIAAPCCHVCTRHIVSAESQAYVPRIARQSGDAFRHGGAPAVTPGMGARHMTLNRGKRSLLLNLKEPGDTDILRKLIPTADVFLHNVRLSAIEKLGFGHDEVRASRPDIVYVHCAGFGSDGPYASLSAYDDVIQAASGMLDLAARATGGGPSRYFPVDHRGQGGGAAVFTISG